MGVFIQEHRVDGANEVDKSADEVTRLKIELDMANARIKELEESKKKKAKKSVQLDVTIKRILHIGPVGEVSLEDLTFSGFIAKVLKAQLNKPKGKKKAKKKPTPTNN